MKRGTTGWMSGEWVKAVLKVACTNQKAKNKK